MCVSNSLKLSLGSVDTINQLVSITRLKGLDQILELCLAVIWERGIVEMVEPEPRQTARRQWEPFPGTQGRVLLVRGLARQGQGPILSPKRAHQATTSTKGP